MVITRRGLVAAGAGVLLAGCGADAEPTPPDAELLGAVAALEHALVRAYERVPGELGRDLGAAREALAAGCGTPAPASEPPGGDPLEAALTLERRCLGAALAAIADSAQPAHRGLAADADHRLRRARRDPPRAPRPRPARDRLPGRRQA